jgi:glycosyltransferase involved in cell wall biosynthesis
VTSASIVIPSRAGAARLPGLFASLAAQTSAAWEAIVVLDGDVDDSATVVDEWAGRIPVRSVAFEQNRGRAAALNAGFRASTGDILIRCDDDLELRPTHVAGHLARHSGDPTGVVGLCKNVFPPTPFGKVYGVNVDARLRATGYAPGAVAWRYWAANVSVTRAVADAVGEYDEGFRAYGWEDVDWGYRLHLAGFPVVIAQEVEALHHGAAATTAARAQRAFYSGAARRRFDVKHGPLAPPTKAPTGAWGGLVRSTAARLSERSVMRRGASIDALLPALPRPVGHKAVALLVESAAIAGYASSGDTEQAI